MGQEVMKDECPLLAACDLHKTYRKNADQVRVLRGLDLEVEAGEFACVVGASGSGKSTMLHLLGTLDRPDQGEIRLEGERIDNLPSERRDRLRNQTFGFIFQFYHLLPELNTLENVLVPHMIAHSLWSWFGQRCVGGARSCWIGWALAIDCGTGRESFPAAKCSGQPSPAPSSTIRAFCLPMSRPAISMLPTARKSSASSAT